MKKLLMGVLAGTLLWTASAGAQQRPKLKVVSEGLVGPSCGMDKSSIESISALTLRNNGIDAAASDDLSVRHYLYIQPTFIQVTSDTCVFNIHVEVKTIGPAPASIFKSREIGDLADIVLCSSGALYVTRTSGLIKKANDSVEQHIKLCLGTLRH